MEIKVDLHHLLIGFHDFWIEKQVKNLEKNLLEILIKECFKKDVTVCAIVSQYEKDSTAGRETEQIDNKKFGLIHDRFGYLVKEAGRIQYKYNIEVDDENILLKITDEKTGRKLGVFNSQVVGAEIKGKRWDTMVIGGNRIPNNMSLEDTLKWAKEEDFINIYEHVAPELAEKLEKYEKYYSAFAWDAQKIFPKWVNSIPIIGEIVKNASKENNEDVMKSAEDYKKPLVCFSNAHSPEGIGESYFKFEDSDFFNRSSKDALLKLKEVIETKKFKNHFEYTSFQELFAWRRIFSKGVKKYLADRSEESLGNGNLYIKGFLS